MTEGRVLFIGRVLTLCEINGWEYTTRSQDGVAILPYRLGEAGYQRLLRREIIPCWGEDPVLCAITGLREQGETPEGTAVRELGEESGFVVVPHDLRRLGACKASKSSTTSLQLYAVDLTGKRPVKEPESGSVEWTFFASDLTLDPIVGLLETRLHNDHIRRSR